MTQELADLICERVAMGETLSRVCEDENMPDRVTVWRWTKANEEFRNAYARAREAQMETWSDDLLDISDDGRNDWMERNYGDDKVWVENGEAIRRSALRIDTRKFLMAKIAPKRYGDRLALEHGGKDGAPIVPVINLSVGPAPASKTGGGATD